MKKKRFTWIALIVLVLFALSITAGCGGAPPADDEDEAVRVAIVFNSPVADSGWNANAWQGLLDARDKFGIEVAYSENVPLAEYEAAFRDYASQGYDMVMGNGFEFNDAALAVAAEFPDVMFGIINGLEYADNLAGLEFDNVEAGYIAGVAAGLVTQTNKLGFIGGTEIPSMTNFIKGMEAGAASVNPDADVIVTYIGSWDDVPKAKELSLALMGNGVDILVPFASAAIIATPEAAKEGENVYYIHNPNDAPDLHPDVYLTAAIQSTEMLVEIAVSRLLDGTFEGGPIVGNVANGVQDVGSFGAMVPADVQQQMMDLMDDLAAGRIALPEKDG